MSELSEADRKRSELKLLRTKDLSAAHLKNILSLWNSEYPARLSYSGVEELEDYLSSLIDQRHILLINEQEHILAWSCNFIRDEERWFAMILDSAIQGKGYGTELLNLAKQENVQLNGWVIDHDLDLKANGEPYSSPLQFYVKNGFKIEADSRLALEKISAIKISWKLDPL